MSFIEMKAKDFIDVLASKAPVPGGGGASALAGAIGVALGNMVGSLTVGKKKYADVEEEMTALKERCDRLQDNLLACMDRDAEVFEPLSKAYGIPKDDPERAKIMEECLRAACSVPMEIMKYCCEGIECCKEFADKGSALALSDAAVGVTFCKAAMIGASLNVFINTKSMSDREYAADVEKEADAMLEKYSALADEVYSGVVARLRG